MKRAAAPVLLLFMAKSGHIICGKKPQGVPEYFQDFLCLSIAII